MELDDGEDGEEVGGEWVAMITGQNDFSDPRRWSLGSIFALCLLLLLATIVLVVALAFRARLRRSIFQYFYCGSFWYVNHHSTNLRYISKSSFIRCIIKSSLPPLAQHFSLVCLGLSHSENWTFAQRKHIPIYLDIYLLCRQSIIDPQIYYAEYYWWSRTISSNCKT